MADITVTDILDVLRQRGVQESIINEFEKQKIDGFAVSNMTDHHFDLMGLMTLGDRLALRAFCAPKKDDLDEKVERLKEALNSRGKRQGEPGGAERKKKSLKPTLKVEFGWKHFTGGKFIQVKKGKGGGTRSVDINRAAQYDECLSKAQNLFFPNQVSQFGKLTDMADCYLANYNLEKILDAEFTIESYKKRTGMNLPRLYLVTTKANRGQLRTPLSRPSSSSSTEIEIGRVMDIPENLPLNFMQEDDSHEQADAMQDLSTLIATEETLIQSRVAWCCAQVYRLEEPPLTEPHTMSVVFPSKFIKSTQSRTFKPTAVVKDLYSWIGTFHSVPAHFSIVLDKGRILKDLNQPLCQIGNHIVVEVLQIPPDVIRGNEDIMSSELISKCAICREGLLPDEMVARPNQCFHIFHHTCIDEWLKVDEDGIACPICEKTFTSTIVCSTTDEPSKTNVAPESTESHEDEAGKLVFEEYIDNGQDSVQLNEARAKEWEKFSENTVTKTSINRDTIVEDILQLYRLNEALINTTLEVTFMNEPAEDADGLTRELFSQGWKNILPLFFEGTSFHVPRVDPDCSEELFEILGRIASHGFVLTGYFPVGIAPASVISIFDPDALNEKDLIYSFLSFLTEGERAAAEKAIDKSKVSVDDTLLDILSRYNVRQIPTSKSEFYSLFVRIAKCEFVTKPSVLMAAFKRGLENAHPALWKEMDAATTRALYVRLYPTAEKVVELLEPSEEYKPLTQRRDRVFEFLRRYVRSLSKEKVPNFLQFVTGTSLALVPHITVAFTDLSGIQRRPIAHTCTCRVDVSTEYESFAAFCKEFDTIITKEECFQYNSI